MYGFYRLLLFAWIAWCCAGPNTALAGLYKWVDEDGQVHFSQTRPQQQDVSVASVEVKGGGGIKARENDGQVYCGETRVPFDADDEPLIQLANLRGNIEHYRQQKIQAWDDFGEYARRDNAIKINPNASGDLSGPVRRSRQKAEELECVIRWMDHRIDELEPLRQELLKEAKLLRQDYDATKDPCGDAPALSADGSRSPDYQEWARCKSSRRLMNERNEKLRQLKRYESLRSLLED